MRENEYPEDDSGATSDPFILLKGRIEATAVPGSLGGADSRILTAFVSKI